MQGEEKEFGEFLYRKGIRYAAGQRTATCHLDALAFTHEGLRADGPPTFEP
jgi:hypothetical protein